MGEHGKISRLLSPVFGAFFTFASLEAGSETAPGQISIREMKSAYSSTGAKIVNISGKTRVCGVIGDPIEHSLSPIIHNAAFMQLKA